MCFDTKRASFCLPQSTPPQSSLQVARAGDDGERRKVFPFGVLFYYHFVSNGKTFYYDSSFRGFDKDEQGDEEEEKSLGTSKVLVSLSDRTLGGHGYE